VFGHNIGGTISYGSAGAQYIDDTYNTGTNQNQGASFAYSKSNYNAYPLDGVGEHIYLNQGGPVSSNMFRQYEEWVRQAYTKYEGANTTKKTFVTEFGWQTPSGGGVTPAVQDTNLVTSFSALQAAPYVQMAIWFQWQDNPAGNLYFGVLDSTGVPKQAYADYQRFERFEGAYADGTTNSNIRNYFNGYGQAVLGNPFDNGRRAWVYVLSTGYAQDFDGGSHLKLTVMSSTNGTYEVNNLHGLWSFYSTNNGPLKFGFPWNNEFASGSGTRQDFTWGYLTWDAINQVVGHLARPILIIEPGAVLRWTGPFALQSATNVSGPYADVPGATSPYTNNNRAVPRQFFRLRN
jgi:hypothetical protein